MKKLFAYVYAGLAMQQCVLAQGFDPMWAERFQTVLDSVVQANNVKGAAAAVYFPGQGIWNSTTGVASPGVPLTPDKMLGIGSNTKTFLAVVLLKLQEQGILTLNDSLHHWIPQFSYVDSTTTLRQLLTHQSGIFDFLNDGSGLWSAIWADTSKFWTPEEILATIGPPHFLPGHGSRYSNTNYLLAAMVVESATGSTWVQKLHDIIFDPLNLDSTFVSAYEPQNGSISSMYYGQWYYNTITSLSSVAGPAGAIFSTSQEMTQWYKALFNYEIINEASLQEMLEIEPLSLAGMGIFVCADENLYYPRFQHTGTLGGYNSQFLYDEKTGAVCCILTNGSMYGVVLPEITGPLIKVLHDDYPKTQYDAGITKIISPWGNICNQTTTPIVVLKNFGNVPLTSVSIHSIVDGNAAAIFLWSGSLNPSSSVNVTLNDISSGEGYHSYVCCTSEPNGGTDSHMFNDSIAGNFIINNSNIVVPPLFEGFENAAFPTPGWIEFPLVVTQWGRTSLNSFTGQSAAVKCNFWDVNVGAKYNLEMPLIDISNVISPELDFMYAYTYYPLTPYDTLKILISSDCGITWSTLFCEGGVTLATAPPSFWDFNPTSSQWEHKTISLDEFTGSILIRFQDICGFGNNLFLDDIHVQGGTGISQNKIVENNIQIYPNPTKDKITISSSALTGIIQLSIFNVSGEKVLERQLTDNNTQIDISALPQGVYFVRVQDEKKVEVVKMIKQ